MPDSILSLNALRRGARLARPAGRKWDIWSKPPEAVVLVA